MPPARNSLEPPQTENIPTPLAGRVFCWILLLIRWLTRYFKKPLFNLLVWNFWKSQEKSWKSQGILSDWFGIHYGLHWKTSSSWNFVKMYHIVWILYWIYIWKFSFKKTLANFSYFSSLFRVLMYGSPITFALQIGREIHDMLWVKL